MINSGKTEPTNTAVRNQLDILLADDDVDDRFFFEMALKEVPIATRLTTCVDGEKLMTFLADDNNTLPFAVFLDLNMPRKNGSECLAEIKENERLRDLPVIIYSTSLYDEIATLLYQNGAHFYLQKCNYSALPSAIHKILSSLQECRQRPAKDQFIINCYVS